MKANLLAYDNIPKIAYIQPPPCHFQEDNFLNAVMFSHCSILKFIDALRLWRSGIRVRPQLLSIKEQWDMQRSRILLCPSRHSTASFHLSNLRSSRDEFLPLGNFPFKAADSRKLSNSCLIISWTSKETPSNASEGTLETDVMSFSLCTLQKFLTSSVDW